MLYYVIKVALIKYIESLKNQLMLIMLLLLRYTKWAKKKVITEQLLGFEKPISKEEDQSIHSCQTSLKSLDEQGCFLLAIQQ